MEGVVVMKKSELRKYNLAREVLLGKLSIIEFSMLINKSYRQAQRIVKKVKEKDYLGIVHGNKTKVPHNKTPEFIEKKLLDLLKTKYFDFNLTHFKEKLLDDEGISVGKNVIHRIAKKNNLVKRPKRRKKKVYNLRPRMQKEGMLVQFDGSEHKWISNILCDLILGIDDATGKILAAEFFIGETSLHSMQVIRQIVQKHGVPLAFYTDAAAIFGKKDKDFESQICRTLEHIGSSIIIAGSAQAKGRVERLFNTLQDRLIAELRINNIKTIPAANSFLNNTFIPNFNKQFSVDARSAKTAYKPTPLIDYDNVFCRKISRKISNVNSFSWNSDTWVIDSDINYKFSRININTHLDGSNSFDIMGKKVNVKKYLKNNSKKNAA